MPCIAPVVKSEPFLPQEEKQKACQTASAGKLTASGAPQNPKETTKTVD
jgi:hypothetical protein